MSKRPLFFRRTLRGLEPSDRGAEDAVSKISIGDVVRADIKRPRNTRQHRLYWALLGAVADNLPDDVTAEVLHDVVKLRTGHYTVVRTRRGEVQIPGSIAFGKMDQAEFDAFFERVLKLMDTDIIPGIGSEALREHVHEMVR